MAPKTSLQGPLWPSSKIFWLKHWCSTGNRRLQINKQASVYLYVIVPYQISLVKPCFLSSKYLQDQTRLSDCLIYLKHTKKVLLDLYYAQSGVVWHVA